MSDRLEIPIWSRGINFVVYNIDVPIEFDEMVGALRRYSEADILNNTDGWVIEPEFVNDFRDLACFTYLVFKKNANASRLQENDVMNYDYAGFAFDFNNNLLIISTAGRSKLELLDRVKAFDPIRDLSPIKKCDYSGKFLLWLSHRYLDKSGSICDGNSSICTGIRIDDISAITNDIKTINLSNAVIANTQVTHFCQTKVILGLTGVASGMRLKITALNNNKYEFNFYSDGRIVAKNMPSYEMLNEKIAYAEEIHNIINKCYIEYIRDIELGRWSEDEVIKYRIEMLRDAQQEINRFMDSAIETVGQKAERMDD